jgi:hypothetical protein
VAVSKRQPASAVLEAFEVGARDFGESYVTELADKVIEVRRILGERADAIRWHFIGGLQSRKAQSLVGVSLVHSVCRHSQLARLARTDGISNILIQVNLSGEQSKDGVAASDLVGFVGAALETPGVSVRGLMTMPAPVSVVGRDAVSANFRSLAELQRQCRGRFGEAADCMVELSMGMSDDFELAIAAGATLVRVGSAIFGARQ